MVVGHNIKSTAPTTPWSLLVLWSSPPPPPGHKSESESIVDFNINGNRWFFKSILLNYNTNLSGFLYQDISECYGVVFNMDQFPEQGYPKDILTISRGIFNFFIILIAIFRNALFVYVNLLHIIMIHEYSIQII